MLAMGLSVMLALAVPLQATRDAADAECIAALMLTSEQVQPSEKSAFETASMFFLGKLYARQGSAAGNSITKAEATITKNTASTISIRCVERMETEVADAIQ